MKKIGSKRPLYTVVQEELLELIREWDHTRPIPSETDLSKEMGVSRSTVREAIQNLEKSDILYKRHGVGTFINQKGATVTTAINNLHGIQNIVRSMGKTPGFKEQVISIITPPDEVYDALEITGDSELIEVSQIYLADDVAIIKGISYLNPILYSNDAAGFIEKIRSYGELGHSLFRIIDEETSYSVDYAVAKIEAISAAQEIAEALDLPQLSPVLRLKETHYDNERIPLIFSMDYIDTTQFEILVVRKRSF